MFNPNHITERLRITLPREQPKATVTLCAAVAILLRSTDGATELLLIERAQRKGDPWSGHLAFPGGHADVGDEDLLATVHREIREELGWDLDKVSEHLGNLSTVPVRARGGLTGTTMVPFVFSIDDPGPWSLDLDEVARAFWLPVHELATGRFDSEVLYDRGGQKLRLPAYQTEHGTIWGLTYQMLNELLRVLT